MVRFWIALLLSFLLLSGRADAQEQGTDPKFCGGNVECGQHYNQARQLSKKGDTERAIAEYQATYGLKPFPPLLFNIARLYHKSGNLRQAVLHYKWYLDSPMAGDDAQREQARRYFAEAINELRTDTVLPEQPMPAPLAPRQPIEQPAPLPAPVVSPALPAAPPAPIVEQRPVYKRWWFWTVIGVVVAGGVAGAVAGSLVTKSPPSDFIRPDAPVYMPTF